MLWMVGSIIRFHVHHAGRGIGGGAALIGSAVFSRHFDGLPIIGGRRKDAVVAGFFDDAADALFIFRIDVGIDVIDCELLPGKGRRTGREGLCRPGVLIGHVALRYWPLFDRPYRLAVTRSNT